MLFALCWSVRNRKPTMCELVCRIPWCAWAARHWPCDVQQVECLVQFIAVRMGLVEEEHLGLCVVRDAGLCNHFLISK